MKALYSRRCLRALAGIALTVGLPPAQAAERILLTNGFDLVCDHHALSNGRVRIFTQRASADFVELSAESIQRIETIPDQVSSATTTSPAQSDTSPALPAMHSHGEQLTSADLHELLSRAGSEHHVDADLLASLVKAESNGNARAVSRAGARGLMQLMPGTARELGVSDSFEPAQNIRGGTAYFDGLLLRYHDNIALALAAYNAGPEAVDRYHGVPPYRETRAYVAHVIHEFNRRVAVRRSEAAVAASHGMGAQ